MGLPDADQSLHHPYYDVKRDILLRTKVGLAQQMSLRLGIPWSMENGYQIKKKNIWLTMQASGELVAELRSESSGKLAVPKNRRNSSPRRRAPARGGVLVCGFASLFDVPGKRPFSTSLFCFDKSRPY